ncbi:uncharacterized protein LOC121633091 isoform X2 [Melanotaenia boesemani]|uniref:uncharacterized protein LOC121633091 isoform X2 n=1 Tax=Melanotaenia boesemani TaxID=1250792 RepID=UPI001C054E90|nr:uncharacterized protein LOC121633091 isoform X2 [Melanotaenia boesemani]
MFVHLWRMGGGKHLLLLPAIVLLVRCQDIPQVSMLPSLKDIFVGDRFYLHCDSSSSGDTVEWYLNEKSLSQTNKTLRIAAAGPDDSGSYKCESNGKKSSNLDIIVLEYLPIASLLTETGQPVMNFGGSVILKIEKEDGLQGWNCWVFRGEKTNKIKIKINQQDDTSLSFQPNNLRVPETIFWCTDETQALRSNQVTVRTSDKRGALEIYPLPAVAGQSLGLRCLVWGTDKVSETIFYRNNTLLVSVNGATHNINDVEKSQGGIYSCEASYKYRDQTTSPHKLVSDTQEVSVQVSPIKAELSENMLCSCPLCISDMTYRYYKKEGESWTALGHEKKPETSGTYQCRAVSDKMRTLPSMSVYYQPSSLNAGMWIALILCLLVLGVLMVAIAAYYLRKKKNNTGQTYEEVGLRLQGDDKYDTLQPCERETEYDTLNPGASGGQEIGGEYEALNKKEMKDGVYDTLEATGAEGGDGGYEALKKDKIDGAEYQTLKTKSSVKKNETDGGEYQTLDKSTLKEGTDKGEYQTLDKSALKEGTDEGEYQTL